MSSENILHAITVAGKPGDLVETTSGTLTYVDWLHREKARIARKAPDWPLAIFTNSKTHEVSLVLLRSN
jgi:hypothetical protein